MKGFECFMTVDQQEDGSFFIKKSLRDNSLAVFEDMSDAQRQARLNADGSEVREGFILSKERFFKYSQRIADLERQLKAEREINDRLRVVETERAVRNDELYEVLGETVDALYSSYDATEWPADGTSYQEVVALKGQSVLEKHTSEFSENLAMQALRQHPHLTRTMHLTPSELTLLSVVDDEFTSHQATHRTGFDKRNVANYLVKLKEKGYITSVSHNNYRKL